MRQIVAAMFLQEFFLRFAFFLSKPVRIDAMLITSFEDFYEYTKIDYRLQ